MKAILRTIRISPKKANLVAGLVRKKSAQEAIDVLKFTPKKAAPVLKKLIESAVANAENNFKQEKESLYIKEIIVTEGPTYKRGIPVSRGRMHRIRKRTSHITVYLEQQSGVKPTKVTKKEDEAEKKVAEKKTVPKAKETKKEAPKKKTAAKKTTKKTTK